MNIIVSLAPDFLAKKPEIGEVVKIQIFFDQKIGGEGDGWEIVSEATAAWIPAGGVTASVASVRALPTDSNATKLEFEAMVHQPGPLIVGPFLLRNQVSKEEVEVPATMIAGTEIVASTKPAEEPPWLQAPIRFGDWDWITISALLVALIALGAIAGRFAWIRLRERLTRHLTHTELALNALANLQKYARSKKPLQLEEWKKFSFELAGILRKYSDENFKVDSRDMTDREFLHSLKLQAKAAPWVNLISGILATITEVRYGRKELDTSVVPGLLLDARKFVESTSIDSQEGSEKR